MFRARLFVSALLTTCLTSVGLGWSATPASAASRTFYVDCVAGSDGAPGDSTAGAWKTITRANKAVLVGGDSLLFKRGCVWSTQALRAAWTGTALAPVTIATYGTDLAQPQLTGAGIVVTGKYQTVDGFQVGFPPVKLDPCGQPLGTYYALVITQGGAHNTVTNNLLTQATAGIHISKTAGEYNAVTRNVLAGNNVMQEPFDGSGDLGAWGMLVRGSHNDISYNTFRDNRAVCLKGKYYSSNSVEIYEGDFNSVHHNIAENDRVFSELGGSETNKSTDNTFEFNLADSSVPGARFITTRGSGDTAYGPVMRTLVTRNTIYFTGAGSQGLVCSLGCKASILTASYNIIDVVEKTIYFDATMGAVNNILWAHGLAVKIEDGARNMRTIPPGVTPATIVAEPGFVDPANGDFRLLGSSPGINKGGATNYTTDLLGNPASNGGPDIGAHEYTPPPPPSSDLANSSFEADVDGDTRPDSWTSLAAFTDGQPTGPHRSQRRPSLRDRQLELHRQAERLRRDRRQLVPVRGLGQHRSHDRHLHVQVAGAVARCFGHDRYDDGEDLHRGDERMDEVVFDAGCAGRHDERTDHHERRQPQHVDRGRRVLLRLVMPAGGVRVT